jgi:hypothetical protein
MPDTPVPWVGLAALVVMFLPPYLPEWLFEGPRTIRHRSHRHVCGDCGAPWTEEHTCGPAERGPGAPLRGELRRLGLPAEVGPPQGPDVAIGPHRSILYRETIKEHI